MKTAQAMKSLPGSKLASPTQWGYVMNLPKLA
jgi:hypothetical protein